jgi:hypothetical protein
MDRPILNIEYKGPIPRAYIFIGGHTREGSRSHAKAVSRVLRERLPTSSHIIPPYFLKFDPESGKYLFRIVVYGLEDQGKAVLAELALKGSV